jgi:tape measure domain-containing protein
MAERIKGLQIDLSLNDMDVSKKLASVKREFRALNTSMKVSNNNFKYGDKSAASYKNRMNELKTAVDGSSKHLSQLKQRHAEVVAQQGAGSKAALDLANQINKETDAFNMYKSQLSSVTKEYQQNFSTLGKLKNSFSSVGSGMQKAGGKMQGVGKKLTSGITKPALMAGGALAGIAITKGFGRLVEIDTAKAKLSALGNSAKDTDTIMNNALESVKGTSFGMGEAATTAANAVAAGIKPGKQLTQYLTNTADAAAIAGIDMSEMGSIMNKVQTQNKAYNGELQQLSDRGLPVYQWLAKEAHVSADEVTDMASKGEISSKMLQSAIQNNIGGAAKEMGKKSFTAALANMWAALGRVGAAFLDAGGKGGGFFSQLKPIMNNLTETFDNMGPQAEKWGASLGSAFSKVIAGITGIVKWYQGLDGGTQKVFGGLAKWLAIILITMGPVLTVFGKMASTIGSMFSGMSTLISFLIRHNAASKASAAGQAIWNGVTATARGIANGYRAAVTALTTSQTIQAIKSKIAAAATVVWTGVTKAATIATRGLGLAIRFMSGPIGWIITIVGALTAAIIYLWKTNSTFRNAVITIWNAIKNAAIATFGFIKPYIINIWNAIKNSTIAIWNGIKTSAVIIWNGIKFAVQHPIQALKNVLSALWNGMKAAAIKIWTLLKNGVLAIIRAYVAGVKFNFNLVKRIVLTIFNAIKAFSTRVWNAIKNGILNIVRILRNGITNIFKGIKNTVTTIFNAVKNFSIKVWNAIKNGVINRARGLWNGVRNTFNALKKGTIAIFNAVKNVTLKVWTSIKNAVVSRAKGLWSGVRNTWNNLKKGTTATFKAVGSFMSSKWNSIRTGTVNKAKSTWSGVKGAWAALSKGTRNTMNAVGGFMSKKWNGIKNSTVGLVTVMKNKVTGVMNKMGNVIKKVTGNIKGFFTGMIDKVKGGLNKLISGVNWVGGKLGMDKLPKVKLHTGTEHTTTQNVVTNGKINRDTFATVGDKGRGNGPGGFRHEAIRYPNGKMALTPNRDTTAFLPKGSSVMNGAQTHSMLSGMPKFANGTNKKKKQNILEQGKNLAGAFGEKASDAAHGVKEGTQKALEASAKAIGKGKKWLGDKVGDVMDWVGKPGKLFNKIADAFGINLKSFGVPKGATLPYDMMKGMFGKLKDAAINMIKGWMDEAGGDGDASWLFKHDIWQKFGNYTGGLSFNGGKHYGVDFGMPIGTNVYAVKGGKADKVWTDYGGGKSVQIKTGKGEWNWYMHLSKQIAKQGQKIKAGQLIGKSGDTGNYVRGAHLHFQLMKGNHAGNDTAVDPLGWLKKLKGGGKKAAKKWAPDIKRAAKQMKVNLSGSELNDIIKLISTESSGDAGIVQQINDVNTGANRARGLLQYTPGTFGSYKVKGHGNIMSGYDQLLAFFNNSSWRGNLSAWKRRMAAGSTGWGPTGSRRFATGGLINSSGWYNLAEGGYPEFVIPTDPSRQSDAMKLLAIASEHIGKRDNNKRPNQMRTPSTGGNVSSDNTELLLQMIANQQKQLDALMDIARSNASIEQQPKGFTERDVSQAQGKQAQMMAYNLGGAF